MRAALSNPDFWLAVGKALSPFVAAALVAGVALRLRDRRKNRAEVDDATKARIWERIQNNLVAAEFERWAKAEMATLREHRPEETDAVIKAVTQTLRDGRTPLSVNVHRHPSGVVVDVVCAEDAAEQAQHILKETA